MECCLVFTFFANLKFILSFSLQPKHGDVKTPESRRLLLNCHSDFEGKQG